MHPLLVHFQREPDVEVLRGPKARFTILLKTDASGRDLPGWRRADREAGAARLARGLLTTLVLAGLAGGGGAMLIHSETWRYGLPYPLLCAVSQARSALLHVLAAAGIA